MDGGVEMSDSAEEQIVLVNEKGQAIGVAPKLESHHANTPLHLAFSSYIFDDKGQFLVTQRALVKKVWPGVWTNSCCGHPGPGEEIIDAIKRRLDYELGMTAKDFAVLVPNYIYTTTPFNGIIDHEFCPIYIGHATSLPKPNPDEVEAFKWMSWPEYIKAAKADTGDVWSWWCKDQLKLIKDHPLIKKYAQA